MADLHARGAISTEHVRRGLLVRFLRPEARNPLSIDIVEALLDIVSTASADAATDRVIITGTVAVFASGADLREVAAVDSAGAREFAARGQRLMGAVADLGKPVVAAINGHCFGGALDLALACSRRVAAPTASFAHPGARLGIITGWGGTQRLPRLVGTALALELFFSASAIDAERAMAIGLVDEIVEDPVAWALR